MAIRQLHYCTHCGFPLEGGLDGGLKGGLTSAPKFCPACGHRLVPAMTVIPRRPALRVAPAPSAQPAAKAPIERRLAAAAVDLALAGVAALVAWALGAEISVILNGTGRGAHHGSLLAWSLVGLVLAGYQPLFWTRSGRTPGMQLVGIRLVSANGSRISPVQALARMGAMVLAALPFGLGFAGAWRDPDGRTWHDRIARTRVVGPPR